ncbi:hypothetical protein Tco_0500182 [Tanacetum coccineum]
MEMQNVGNQTVENLNRNVAALVEMVLLVEQKESMILLNADDANEEVRYREIHANCLLKEKPHEVELDTKAAIAHCDSNIIHGTLDMDLIGGDIEHQDVDDEETSAFLESLYYKIAQLADLKGKSVDNEFAKPSIWRKPPSVKPLITSSLLKSRSTPNESFGSYDMVNKYYLDKARKKELL